ncbi:MAG: UDP-N-acetylglucosamine--N-acetylmuramyl-(pentapeptide) pyrophosphoryl-undecaprenol N-acetylglucosamine transferase [Pseudomonadota bacterium]
MAGAPTYDGLVPPVLLGAGGTGGHMFPAQAVAEALKRRGHRVLLITDARGNRFTDAFPADRIVEISAANPNARGPMAKVSAALALTGGLIRSLQEIRRAGVAVAVGFGGYPSFPALQAAALSRVRYGVHEQNSLLGRANRALTGKAAFVAHGFSVLKGVPTGKASRIVSVGNPVRGAVADLAASPYAAPHSNDPFRLLITGGSQGASLFAHAPAKALAGLPTGLQRRLVVTHQVRAEDAAGVRAIYEGAGISHTVAPFFEDLPAAMAQAHLVIARAGASTLTELATIGRPSLLVPLAIAMDDHQTVNAQTLVAAGAATLLAEHHFTEDAVRTALAQAMENPDKLAHMAAQTNGLVPGDAANAIVDLIEEQVATAGGQPK